MGRLHRRDQMQLPESLLVLRRYHLCVFNAIPPVARWIHAHNRFEGVQRDAIRFISNGMKRNLKS